MKDTDAIMALLREQGVIRLHDVKTQGLSPASLYWLHRKGQTVRAGRGCYVLPEPPATEHHTLALASQRVPHAVVCLLTALRFHGLTTQAPFEVWLALENKAWQPTSAGLPLRFVRFSGAAFTAGVELHAVEDVQVKVYGVAKLWQIASNTATRLAWTWPSRRCGMRCANAKPPSTIYGSTQKSVASRPS